MDVIRHHDVFVDPNSRVMLRDIEDRGFNGMPDLVEHHPGGNDPVLTGADPTKERLVIHRADRYKIITRGGIIEVFKRFGLRR